MKKLISASLSLILSFTAYISMAQSLGGGIKAMDYENYRSAQKIFSALSTKNPADAEALYYTGKAYYALEQKDSAKLFFEKGITANPKLALNYVGLGRYYLDLNNASEAKANFDKAVSLALKDVTPLQFIGEAYANAPVKTGSDNVYAPDAIAILNKALSVDKKNTALTYLFLGDAYLSQWNGAGKALSQFELLAQNPSIAAIAQTRIGTLNKKAKIVNEALSAFEKGIKADSLYPPAYRELAELYYQSGQYQKAKDTYKKYLDKSDYSVQTQSRYGDFLYLAKDYEGAIEVISKIIEKDPSDVFMNRLIGYSYYEKGKYQEGLAAMDKFFKTFDSKKLIAKDYEYYGKLLSKTGNDSLAIVHITTAIAMDSTKGDLHAEIAQLYFKKKKYAEAAFQLECKIAKTKANIQDYNQLGQCYFKSDSFIKADSAFAKVVELNPNAYLGYLWRGKSNWQIDSTMELGSAKPFYEKAIELALLDSANANNKKALVDGYTYLGSWYIKNKQDSEGVKYFEKVLAIDPKNDYAKNVVNSAKKINSGKSKS